MMKAECTVCIHHCMIEEGNTGLCRARTNRNGEVVCSSYGKITSLALDPIEKKPLRRFYPGSRILSLGSYGCNLNCPFCQNYSISMVGEEETEYMALTPEALVGKALSLREIGNIGIAYTYNEPLVGYEFVLDCARLGKEKGLKNVVVTNGNAAPAILQRILPYIDAFNVDLKGFTEAFYQKLGGDLNTVKDFIKSAAGESHVEVTMLIIPGENDDAETVGQAARFLASIDESIPLHVSRFFPQWKMLDRKATEVEVIRKLAKTAREYLKYVFMGNCQEDGTVCQDCQESRAIR